MLKPAKLETTVGTSGTETPRPTGGFDPLGQDLRLREVNVTSFSEAAASAQPSYQAPAATPVSATEPQATATTGTENQPPAATTGTESLPKTASPLPLVGLIGLLSLAAAFGLHAISLRRTD